MIIKGGSRAAPSQLAWHLQRRDTNERIEILELQSPAPNLGEAFRDWQTLVEGTRGSKGLYHANIDPAKDYTMTREQWQRSVDVLEKELGLEGQPRAVVMHEKHGREHIHVVWARTDIDRMVVRSDSQNYLAHERASQALEREFGHEEVPGKHAKRDREKQPEFPKAEANQAEWQQGERTGIDPAARKDQVTALKQTCDNGQAFKTALEEQGYILAQGDRRDFVIVDQTGSIHSLGRQIRGLKAAELRSFMKDVDRETLPTAAEAVNLQEQRQGDLRRQQNQQQQPDQQEARQQEADRQTAEKPSEATPADAPPQSDNRQAETEALRKAVAERQAEERRRLIESHADEMKELRKAIDLDTKAKLDRFDNNQNAELETRVRRYQEQAPTGVAGLVSSVQDFFFPARVAEREGERQREQQEFAARQKQRRDDYAALLQKTNKLEIENVTERHELRLSEHASRGEEDLDRYIREREAARRLQAEVEERERQRAEELARDGPERPPPRRAR